MKNRIYRWIVMVSVVALFAGQGCGSAEKTGVSYEKDGKTYGTASGVNFRHRWWNYFERALSYMEGEFYDEAASDLTTALAQRDGDQRMARTYGMHFIDYFPNRELGIVFFKQNRLDDAESQLNRSLQQYPTAKAFFYLDKVRAARIKSSGAPIPPPEISLDAEEGDIWTRDDPVVISGVVRDPVFVSEVMVNDRPQYIDGAEKQVRFHRELALPQGGHRIRIFARNLGNKESSRVLTVHVDREGPQIVLAHSARTDEPARGNTATLSGTAFDDTTVEEISINGALVSFDKGPVADFKYILPLDVKEAAIRAQDRLGNVTSVTIPLENTPTARKSAPLLAGLSANASDGVPVFLSRNESASPPLITMKEWRNTETVFLETIYLEGEVSSEADIVSLSVNGVSVLKRAGKRILFSNFIRLDEGENEIIVAAENAKGETSQKSITVMRRLPTAFKADERMRLTVFPFQNSGAALLASQGFQDNLLSALVTCNRFKVLERAILDAVLREQKISASSIVDTETKVHLGKLAAAQGIIAGHIIETRIGVEVVSRVVDTETAEILTTTDVYSEAAGERAFRQLARAMAVKIHREFPLVSGEVVGRDGDTLLTDLGEEELRAQRNILIYESRPVLHPVSGKSLGEDHDILGRARVVQLDKEISKARIRQEKHALKLMDRVITE
jgi:hypothetical protein